MKKIILIILIVLISVPVFAADNGVSITVIGGERETPSTSSYRPQERAIEKPIEISNLNVKIIRYDSIGHVYFSVKADITNKGQSRKVYVGLQGIDFEGYERATVYLSDYIEEGQTKAVSTERGLNTSEYNKIREWRVKNN